MGNSNETGGMRLSVKAEEGSFIVAAIFFMFIFMSIAAFGIDGARYYLKKSQLQNIADGAALKGAQSFNQYDTQPQTDEIRNSILEYIEDHQSEEHRDLYQSDPMRNEGNIQITNMNTSFADTTCTEGFAIRNNQVVLTQPSQLQTQVLGSQITQGPNGPPIPVTSQIQLTQQNGTTTNRNPWGNFNNPNQANLNTPNNIPPAQIQTQNAGSTVSVRAQSWQQTIGNNFQPLIQAQTGPGQGNPAITLSNGDQAPAGQGFANQNNMQSFIQPYIDSNGRISLQQNQAIMFFEVGATNTNSNAYDQQDLVLLLSVNPTNNGPNIGSGRNTFVDVDSQGVPSSPCSPYPQGTHRVGVLTFEEFEPFFLPKDVFGEQKEGLVSKSVAEVRPENILQTRTVTPECGMVANRQVGITGNNVNGSGMNICSNDDIIAFNSANGSLGDLFVQGQSRIQPPGGSVGRTITLRNPFSVPTFNNTDPAVYDVDLSDISLWTDQGLCSGGGGGNTGTTRALRTQTASQDVLQWSDGGNVCVTYNSTLDRYTISNNNGGQIQHPDGSPVSIYADADVTFGGNGTGINGGLYATGDITVNDNNHNFLGDPSKLGGLSLWAQGDVTFNQNNIQVDGLTGAGGDYTFGSSGGGTGPSLNGKLITGGRFSLQSNSNNATLNHDPTQYNENALDNLNGQRFQQRPSDRPRFSNIRVRLIN